MSSTKLTITRVGKIVYLETAEGGALCDFREIGKLKKRTEGADVFWSYRTTDCKCEFCSGKQDLSPSYVLREAAMTNLVLHVLLVEGRELPHHGLQV